jgi:hypothetical protein
MKEVRSSGWSGAEQAIEPETETLGATWNAN